METKLSSVLRKIENSKKFYVEAPHEPWEQVTQQTYDREQLINMIMADFVMGDGYSKQDILDTVRETLRKLSDNTLSKVLEEAVGYKVTPASRDDMHSLCVHDMDEEHGFDDGW
jgi:hypothetical protein